MENIQIFTKHTVFNRRGKPPVVRLSKSGHIRFSVTACKNLDIKEGDCICFMIDARDVGIVYFYKDNKNGMPLKYCTKGKDGINGLQICCRPMAMKILAFFNMNGNRTFDVSSETTKTCDKEMWFIIKENIHKPIKWKKNDTQK